MIDPRSGSAKQSPLASLLTVMCAREQYDTVGDRTADPVLIWEGIRRGLTDDKELEDWLSKHAFHTRQAQTVRGHAKTLRQTTKWSSERRLTVQISTGEEAPD